MQKKVLFIGSFGIIMSIIIILIVIPVMTGQKSFFKQNPSNLDKDEIGDNTQLSSLKSQITDILGEEIDKYGVFVSTSSTNILDINGDNLIVPASVSKIPIAVMVFRDIDIGKYDLKKTLPVLDSNKAYESDALWSYQNGTELTIEEYLKKMLQNSDNTAMNTLERSFGGYEVVNQRLKDEFGVEDFSRNPYRSKSNSVGKLLSQIIFGDVLSGESRSKLIAIMSDIPDQFQDRIASGVPKGIKVAHKIGQDRTEFGYSYNDAGIVFGQKKSFVIVILNQGVDEEIAISKIRKITEITYAYLNN
jgi:beta-lactamase class A